MNESPETVAIVTAVDPSATLPLTDSGRIALRLGERTWLTREAEEAAGIALGQIRANKSICDRGKAQIWVAFATALLARDELHRRSRARLKP